MEEAGKPIVRIEIDDRTPAVWLLLPAELLDEARSVRFDVVFEARLNGSSFQLEVNVLDLESLAAQLGTSVTNLQVEVVIEAVTGSTLDGLVLAAQKEGMKLLSQAIEFQLFVTGGGQSWRPNGSSAAFPGQASLPIAPLPGRNSRRCS